MVDGGGGSFCAGGQVVGFVLVNPRLRYYLVMLEVVFFEKKKLFK